MDFYRYFRLIAYAIDEGVLFALSDYTVYFSQFAHTFCVYIDIAPFFHTRYLHIDPARSFPQIEYTYTQPLRVKRSAYSYTYIFLSYIYHTHRPHYIYSFSQNTHRLAQFNQIIQILIYTNRYFTGQFYT